MAIIFLTGEDIEEIGNKMTIIEGKVAELATKLDTLIQELKEERTEHKETSTEEIQQRQEKSSKEHPWRNPG